MLRALLVVGCVFCSWNDVLATVANDVYCTDQKIQERIDIKQLTGMWYAVETIFHIQDSAAMSIFYEEPTTIETDICAVITISDRPSGTSTLYRDYYNHTYGQGYNYGTPEYYTDNPTNQYYGGRRHDKDGRQIQQMLNYLSQRKELTITWDEVHTTNVYRTFYTDRAGVWSIYELGEGMKATVVGRIQVLKAVGNHLVLTFCIRIPEQQFFTAILSRTPKLSQTDLSGVHNLLRRLELKFNRIKKLCLLNTSIKFNVNYILFIVLTAAYALL